MRPPALQCRSTALQSGPSAFQSRSMALQSGRPALQSRPMDLQCRPSALRSRSTSLESGRPGLEIHSTSLESGWTGLEIRSTSLQSHSMALQNHSMVLEDYSMELQSGRSGLEIRSTAPWWCLRISRAGLNLRRTPAGPTRSPGPIGQESPKGRAHPGRIPRPKDRARFPAPDPGESTWIFPSPALYAMPTASSRTGEMCVRGWA
jgi:hypothetical protein